MTRLKLRLHDEPLAVGLVPAHANLALTGGNAPIHGSLTTEAGRTIVFPHCLAAEAGPEVRVEGPFQALEVDGPLDFALTGVLAALLVPLADAGISVFTLSTFDTDWILVPADAAGKAAGALNAAGHTVEEAS
ncbi:ACT domain-containing protein [Saccharopolyspora sp. K220]|uniref:ACT domain-containing protein n=1 Tax=Saccharopolyspora soli TaxID=2926618 RepID=UPI001F59BF57|nr:ACT domain-containing protein [Saccharopolyspora soli]MCI2418000.1 ACT domain-containing protein [Saccharopolyspora soli]